MERQGAIGRSRSVQAQAVPLVRCRHPRDLHGISERPFCPHTSVNGSIYFRRRTEPESFFTSVTILAMGAIVDYARVDLEKPVDD